MRRGLAALVPVAACALVLIDACGGADLSDEILAGAGLPDAADSNASIPDSNGSSGSSGSSGDPTDSGGDAATDAPADAKKDAPVDAGCPIGCSECVNGTCRILCSGQGCKSSVTCPAGQPCTVVCAKDACDSITITCAPGQPCRVECAADKGCNSMQIQPGTATSLCLVCNGGGGVNPGCNSISCNTPPASCGKVCGAGGGGCTGIGSCDQCGTIAGCP